MMFNIVWRNFFNGMMIFVCTLTFVVSILPQFDGPSGRRFRGILFALNGVSAAMQVSYLYFFRDPITQMDPDFA